MIVEDGVQSQKQYCTVNNIDGIGGIVECENVTEAQHHARDRSGQHWEEIEYARKGMRGLVDEIGVQRYKDCAEPSCNERHE